MFDIEEELEDLEERRSELFYYSDGEDDEEIDEIEDNVSALDNHRMDLELDIEYLNKDLDNLAKDLNRLKTEREQLTDQLFDYHRKGEC